MSIAPRATIVPAQRRIWRRPLARGAVADLVGLMNLADAGRLERHGRAARDGAGRRVRRGPRGLGARRLDLLNLPRLRLRGRRPALRVLRSNLVGLLAPRRDYREQPAHGHLVALFE